MSRSQRCITMVELKVSRASHRLESGSRGLSVLYRSIFDTVRDFLHDRQSQGKTKSWPLSEARSVDP